MDKPLLTLFTFDHLGLKRGLRDKAQSHLHSVFVLNQNAGIGASDVQSHPSFAFWKSKP